MSDSVHKQPALPRAGDFDFHAAIRLQAGDQFLSFLGSLAAGGGDGGVTASAERGDVTAGAGGGGVTTTGRGAGAAAGSARGAEAAVFAPNRYTRPTEKRSTSPLLPTASLIR